MRITNVEISFDGVHSSNGREHLLGFSCVTFEHCFVVQDLRIINGDRGPFVSMPSRKLMDHCPQCRTKNHLRAKYCNNCGSRLSDDRIYINSLTGKPKYYEDLVYPITQDFREYLEREIMRRYAEVRGQLDTSREGATLPKS